MPSSVPHYLTSQLPSVSAWRHTESQALAATGAAAFVQQDRVHFSGVDKDLPESDAKALAHVKYPPISQEILKSAQHDFKAKQLKIYRLIGNLIRYKLAENKVSTYLPQSVKSRIFWYRTLGQWADRLLKNHGNKGYAQRKLVSMEGPLAVKAKQAKVNFLRLLKPQVEGFQEEVNRAKAEGRIKWWERPAYNIAFFLIHRQFGEIETYSGLFDDVPVAKDTDYQKNIDEVKQAFKRETGNTITEIIRPLGSGSIRRTFLAKVSDGTLVALKVNHPDAKREFFEQYLPMLYYQGLLLYGTERTGKLKALEQAHQQIGLISRESNQKNEKKHSDKLRETYAGLGLSAIRIPKVLVTTDRGVVEELAGHHRYSQASPNQQAQVLTQLAPELITGLALAAEKYIDLQPGNIMYDLEKGQVSGINLIDIGRNISLYPDDYQKFQNLFTFVMGQDLSKPLDIAQLFPKITALSYQLEPSSQRSSQARAINLTTMRNKLDSRLRGDHSLTSSMIAPWAYYSLALNDLAAGLPYQLIPITGTGMNAMDTATYTSNANSLLKRYFWVSTGADDDATLSQTLEHMGPEELVDAFNFVYPYSGKPFYGHISSLCDEIQRFSHIYYSAERVIRLSKDDKATQKAQSKAQKDFEQAKAETKEKHADEWQLIVRAYRVNKRVKDLADRLASHMTSGGDDMANLRVNVEYALRKDFGLRYATPRKQWRSGDYDNYLWTT